GCSDNDISSKAKNKISVPTFDKERAFKLLEQQVEIGPRYPGSAGQEPMIQFMVENLKPYSDEVKIHRFSKDLGDIKLDMANVVAIFNKDAKKWVLLAAHWDTRPIAEMEIKPEKQKQPILGANDGASGVAVLLELARMFKEQPPEIGVFMILFDGEDYGPTIDRMLLGSKYFASNLDKYLRVNDVKINLEYGILLDMVGDKDLKIYQEIESKKAAPDIVEKVWNIAKELGYENIFIPETKYSIMDDHIPLIEKGIKCINIIDFDYAYWHTLEDTIDKCSPDSLFVVGNVVANVIYRENSN
ncbi:MAG: M28 family peptidase, partial [Armatimonadota bacterium]